MSPPNTLHSHFAPSLYGLVRALASLIKNAHSFLSTNIGRQCLNFISRRPFSTSSNHFKRDLPILRLPSGLLSNIFLSTLPWFIPMRYSIQSNLIFFLISATMSNFYIAPAIPISYYSPHSLFYHRSIYPPSHFPFSCIRSFLIHLYHRPYITSIQYKWFRHLFIYIFFYFYCFIHSSRTKYLS